MKISIPYVSFCNSANNSGLWNYIGIIFLEFYWGGGFLRVNGVVPGFRKFQFPVSLCVIPVFDGSQFWTFRPFLGVIIPLPVWLPAKRGGGIMAPFFSCFAPDIRFLDA